MMRAYLLDDEPLALERLSRMLEATGRVSVVGTHNDPLDAVENIGALRPDILFLDIHMPELSGFDVLARLADPPLVIFTTAYEQYALEAFRANSLDYLLKPVESELLDRALNKAERLLQLPPASASSVNITELAERLRETLRPKADRWLSRIGSRTGDKIEFVDLRNVTYFFAKDKLTFAATEHRNFVIDHTISQLALKLDPQRFIQIHRSAIVKVASIQELHATFAGRMVARLKDKDRTELTVSRDRVRHLKKLVGL